MKKSLTKSLLVIYIFCGVFAPPILKINILWVLTFIALVHLICTNRSMSFSVKAKSTSFLAPFILAVYIILNVLINAILDPRDLNRNRLIVIYQCFALIPMQIIVCQSIFRIMKNNDLDVDDLIHSCIGAGILEGVMVVAAFIFAPIRELFLTIMATNAGNDLYTQEYFLSYRAYGFSATLLDTFGYGMGLLAGISLLQKKWTAFTVTGMVFCIFSTLVNSRTGLLIFLVAVFVKGIYMFRNGKLHFKFTSVISILLMAIVIILFINSSIIDSITYEWVKSGFESILNFVSGKTQEYHLGSMQNTLLSERFWHLPKNLWGVIFGEGHSCYNSFEVLGVASDVGYVNYIWIIGILGTTFLVLYIHSLFKKRMNSYINYSYRQVILFLEISFFVMFIKGNIITHCAGTFVTLLFLFYDNDSYKLTSFAETEEK